MYLNTILKKVETIYSNECLLLLGCPWCGKKPEYTPACLDTNNPPYGWPHTLMHNCKVIGRQICIRHDYTNTEDTKEAVFKTWNSRWYHDV